MSGRSYVDPLQYSIEEASKSVNYISTQNLLFPNLQGKILPLSDFLRIWRLSRRPSVPLAVIRPPIPN